MSEKSEDLFRDFQLQELARRLEAIAERISQIASSAAVQCERQRHMIEELTEANKKIDIIDKRLDVHEAFSLKMAGGLAVIIAIGMAIGWITSAFSTILAFFKKLVSDAPS